MSGRGRGRARGGWRGGRSGGRGGLPGLKDDEGNPVVPDKDNGPPQTYPEVEVNAPPDMTPLDKLLISYQDELLSTFKRSPYYIERPVDQSKVFEDKVQRYSDRYDKKVKRPKPPLATFLTLHPELFPDELYSEKAKKLSAAAARSGEPLLPGAGEQGANLVLQHMMQMEEREKKGPAGGRGAAGGEGAAQEGGGEGEEVEVMEAYDEDDDEVMEEDDYYQGEHFDDDEGYDYDDDGHDEGPVY